MLCKLIDGNLVLCPETIRVSTNDEVIKKRVGWMPYVHTDAPEYDPMQKVLSHTYTETNGEIHDVYTLTDIPEGEVL